MYIFINPKRGDSRRFSSISTIRAGTLTLLLLLKSTRAKNSHRFWSRWSRLVGAFEWFLAFMSTQRCPHFNIVDGWFPSTCWSLYWHSKEASGTEFGEWDPEVTRTPGDCAAVSSLRRAMSTQTCSTPLPFVCRWDNVVLVKEHKSWEAALEHCRALGHELVSVEPGDDHGYMAGKLVLADTEAVGRNRQLLPKFLINVSSTNRNPIYECPNQKGLLTFSLVFC